MRKIQDSVVNEWNHQASYADPQTEENVADRTFEKGPEEVPTTTVPEHLTSTQAAETPGTETMTR